MFVFVRNKNGKPLMPTNPAKARILLKTGKAKVASRLPFTIQLAYDSENYTQSVIAGMDTGSKKIGCVAIGNNKVLYQSEIEIRQDVSGKMQQRSMYRRNRRSRKTRYRPARFDNRGNSGRHVRLAPSIRSKLESHLREKKFVESILPVTEWKVELASFDIRKITNPIVYFKKHVSKGDYQQRTGKRSEKRIPTGKLFGLRKFDLIRTEKGTGIVKGKRSTGYFAIADVFGNKIHDSVNVKRNCKRLTARTTTLIQMVA